MVSLRSWFTGARLLAVIVALALSTGSALAWQPDFKDPADEETEDSEQPGLISETEYESPQYDVGITWTDAWKVGDPDNPDVEYAIGGNYDGPVASDPELGDIIFLQDTDTESAVLSLGFSPIEGPSDPELIAEAMDQEEFLTDNLFLSEDAEVVMVDSNETTAAIVAREAAPNDDHIVFMQIVGDPGREDYSFWVGLDLYDPAEYENILTSIEDDIEVEDNDVFDVFSVDEILEAIAESDVEETPAASPTAEASPTPDDDATPSPFTPEATAEASPEIINPPTIPTEAASPAASPVASPVATEEGALPGVVAEGEYVSPQHGVDVTWESDWVLDEDASPAPAMSVEDTGLDVLFLTDAESAETDVFISIENQEPAYEPEQAEATFTSPDYIQGILGLPADTEVTFTDATDEGIGLVYLFEEDDESQVLILEMRVMDDDTVAYVDVRTAVDNVDDELLDAVDDEIQVDGDDAFEVLSNREILNALP
jgi:hypothetical protein